MVKKLYFTNFKEALNAANSNGISCYVNSITNSKTWFKKKKSIEVIFTE